MLVFFRDFLKVILVIIGILMILSMAFGFEVSKLWTGLGIAGVALALATKESIENLIASFIIFFDKPFQTGDVLIVNNITGTVEKIGLRSTRIRTNQKTYVTVPNKQMVDSIVDNQTLRTQRKGEIRLQLDSSTPSDAILRLVELERLREAARSHPDPEVAANLVAAFDRQITDLRSRGYESVPVDTES